MRYLRRYDTLKETLYKATCFTNIRKFSRLLKGCTASSSSPPHSPQKTLSVNVHFTVTVGNVERTSLKHCWT